MTAEDLGRKLLAEVEEGSLNEILAELASKTPHDDRRGIGVLGIDHIANVFNNANNPLRANGQTSRSDHIEITSANTDEGKTQLLHYLAAVATLPASMNGHHIGGKHSTAVYLDCAGTFSITRLVTIMEAYVAAASRREHNLADSAPALSEGDLRTMINCALPHLHVFSPQSMMATTDTIESLRDYLYNSARHSSMHRRVHSIMLDSATSFYWADRHDTDMANLPHRAESGGGQASGSKSESGYPRLRSALARATQELSCPVIYTVNNLFHKTAPLEPRVVHSSLPRSWQTFPTLRLLMQRNEVRGLPVAISAEEAAREAKARNEAVSQGLFTLTVNEADSTEWSADIRSALQRIGDWKIVVRITESGVFLEGGSS